MKMRLLVISQFFPYPPTNGGRMRTYHLLRGLSKWHKIHLLTFSKSPEDIDYAPELTGFCEQVHIAPDNKGNPLASALGFLSPAPRSYVTSRSRDMRFLVNEQVRRYSFDAGLVFGLRNSLYLQPHKQIPLIVDNDNCDTAYMARLVAEAPSSLIKFRRTLTWVKSRLYESRLASTLDAALVVSDEDQKEMALIAPSLQAKRAIHVAPNGADLALLDYRGPEVDHQLITYPGALTYSANYDAAVYFCREVFPLVKALEPECRFSITGNNDGVDLSSFQGKRDVSFTGFLDDVRPAIASSAAVVVPTRIGGGTRLKILEAMALGTPVVSTSFGAAGLGTAHDENILIADTPRDFAYCISRLMRDMELRERITANARIFVAEHYGWESIAEHLNRVIAICCGNGVRKRALD
ncbi:MAG: glycosyltransferase [Armatimonadota bacterium]|nr:glycosyltransferase [Armatimonadota bacterium]